MQQRPTISKRYCINANWLGLTWECGHQHSTNPSRMYQRWLMTIFSKLMHLYRILWLKKPEKDEKNKETSKKDAPTKEPEKKAGPALPQVEPFSSTARLRQRKDSVKKKVTSGFYQVNLVNFVNCVINLFYLSFSRKALRTTLLRNWRALRKRRPMRTANRCRKRRKRAPSERNRRRNNNIVCSNFYSLYVSTND